MPVTPERIQRLRAFGLSEYGARAYLALLDLGTAEARDVAALSKVPASKIYHILDQLHEKRLVHVLPEFPRKYAPVPFGEYLQRLHDDHDAAARRIRDDLDALAHTFAVVGDLPAIDRGTVTVVHGRASVRERIAPILALVQREILLLPTAAQAREPRVWHDAVAACLERGVRVRSLAVPDGRPAHLPGSAFALVADDAHAVLGHCHPDDAHPTEGRDTAIFVEHAGLVQLVAALLDPRDVSLTPRMVDDAVTAMGTRGSAASSAPTATRVP